MSVGTDRTGLLSADAQEWFWRLTVGYRTGRWFMMADVAAALTLAGSTGADATAAARAAHQLATRLGAEPIRREVDLLAQRARLDLVGVRPAERAGAPSPLGLTAREDEVLQLLGRGYTNRQIAVELTISVKTASVHVSNILRKLGMSRRLEAAAVAQRLASPAPTTDLKK